MFERLLRQPRPWRYGHVLLPEGSKNLGNPEYALAPGSKVGGLAAVGVVVGVEGGALWALSPAVWCGCGS